MASNDKLFTLDDLLYYTKFAAGLHCNERIANNIIKSLSDELKAQHSIPDERINEVLLRNGVTMKSTLCGACGTSKQHDILQACPGCNTLVHSQCFWKLNKFCSRKCMLANEPK